MKRHKHKYRFERRIIGGKWLDDVKLVDCRTAACPNVRVHRRLGFR